VPRRSANGREVDQAVGRWTPEFRAWMRAYVSGSSDERELAALDASAREAAEEVREVVRRGERCPTCGRPFASSEALLDLLRRLDRERPVAA